MTPDDFRALQEQAHQLEELQKHPGWEILVDFAHVGMTQKQRYLINGNAKTIEDYREKAGWLQGTQHLLDAAQIVRGMVETEAVHQASPET